MQELKCGGKHITGPNHHHPELGESHNGIKRCLFVGFFFFPFVPICIIFFQATLSDIYRDKQILHTLGLSGTNSSETAACSTCLEILMEFQEPSAMTCLCFSIKIKERFRAVPVAREQK